MDKKISLHRDDGVRFPYSRPETQVIAAYGYGFILGASRETGGIHGNASEGGGSHGGASNGNGGSGGHGNATGHDIGDAKVMILGQEFSFTDLWEE